MLEIKNLVSSVGGKEILHGVSLHIKPGEIHAVMGPNGSGKTSLAMTLMGHPSYVSKLPASLVKGGEQMESSKYEIDGKDMRALLPEDRAKAGLFVSFQNPVEIQGVSFLAFLRTAAKALRPEEKIPLSQFKETVKEALKSVDLEEAFMQRFVNEGFSGGERKRAEIVQLLVLRPRIAILDEIDSGLDVDSLKFVAEVMARVVKKTSMSVLVITHYQRLLHFLKPTHVHILIEGKIKRSGGMELVRQIEKDGYASI